VGPFGQWTQIVFLIGAGAVLFKTLYVASAAHSRLTADFCSLAGLVSFPDDRRRRRWVQGFCAFYPTLALVLFFLFREPRAMVVFGAIGQAATLPIISAITVYFRYRGTDRRLAPSWAADICLWVALISMSLVAAYAIHSQVRSLFELP
jgi:Mn2+/Fe2+ NRAMP family transporter